jgi:hypothetical protein
MQIKTSEEKKKPCGAGGNNSHVQDFDKDIAFEKEVSVATTLICYQALLAIPDVVRRSHLCALSRKVIRAFAEWC